MITAFIIALLSRISFSKENVPLIVISHFLIFFIFVVTIFVDIMLCILLYKIII